MDGVTILNTYEVYNNSEYIVAGSFIMLLGMLLSVVTIAIAIKHREKLYLLATLLGIAIFIIGAIFCNQKNPPVTQYTVTIDEEVSLIEFNEKYVIIEQNGLLFEIQERE